jgi:hypothetical protein
VVKSGRVVRVELVGGLGNQMFAFAAGLDLARRWDARLELDTAWFGSQSKRGYELGAFELLPECHVIDSSRDRNPLQAVLRRLPPPLGWTMMEEQSFRFDPTLQYRRRRRARLAGYRQSPKYFAGSESAVATAFRLRGGESSGLATWTGRLAALGPTVSVHVRRGDYVSDPIVNRFHGLVGRAYYEEAILHIRAVSGLRPTIILFSDDLDAARSEVDGLGPIISVADGLAGPAEEIVLMSRCDHHVIANSSFSWWGAWLDRTGDGITVAPRKWFAGADPHTHEAIDLLPPGWACR